MSNPIITVVYSHGRFGSPWYGSKIESLRPIALQLGANIISVKYPEEENVEGMEERLWRCCLDEVTIPGDVVFLSSSRGAYISTRVSRRLEEHYASEGKRVDDDIPLPARHVLGSFLIAPAFYIKPEYYPDQDPAPGGGVTAIVHGLDDTVIDVENSIRFARKHGHQLYLLPGGHRMNSQIDSLRSLFDMFLRSMIDSSRAQYAAWRIENPDVREKGDDVRPQAIRDGGIR